MRRLSLSLVALLPLLIAAPAEALIISATEVIEDLTPQLDPFSRDLRRTRFSTVLPASVTNNDATIVAQNNVDGDFGIYNFDNVSYQHNVNWSTPPALTYLAASLQIEAFGPDGGNDSVFSETINLGSLVSDGSLLDFFTTTVFAFNNQAQLNLLLADGILNVTVNKVGFLDAVSVTKSSLTVRYEAVPEPATVALLSSGLLGGAFFRRRQARA
ncbi:MAG: PEP-CTERM sorting domain-containing protein [Deltaproteobacteria bacterium]|nr:PEP-CTERM sorting domain-containing protein [Deltaproteobacteria bacterium]